MTTFHWRMVARGIENEDLHHHGYPHVDPQGLHLNAADGRLEPPDLPRYGFTNIEPFRIDTGPDYMKLPLCTFVKVHSKVDHRLRVDRIHFTGIATAKTGLVPAEGITILPDRFVPRHIILADSFNGKVAKPAVGVDCSYDTKPYYDAGPLFEQLNDGDIIRVNKVDAESCSINLLDEKGGNIGFAKIPLHFLMTARLLDSSELPFESSIG